MDETVTVGPYRTAAPSRARVIHPANGAGMVYDLAAVYACPVGGDLLPSAIVTDTNRVAAEPERPSRYPRIFERTPDGWRRVQ